MIRSFKYKYPQSFLDELAKAMGVELTKVQSKLYSKDDIEVKPMNPPTAELFYMEYNYKKK